MAFLGQTQGQIDRHGRFTYPAFAAHHQDFVFDFSQGLGNGDILLSQPGISRPTVVFSITPAGTAARTAHDCLQQKKKKRNIPGKSMKPAQCCRKNPEMSRECGLVSLWAYTLMSAV
jgi:hypothetical protein